MRPGAQSNPYAVPVRDTEAAVRSGFLRRVGMVTLGGLAIASTSAVASAVAVATVDVLQQRFVTLAVMLGCIFGSRALTRATYSADATTRIGGFVAGTALQGIAMGYLLLMAVSLSTAVYGNPLVFLVQTFVVVGATVLGMCAYLMSGPKQLSMVGAAMSALALPMLALMVLTALWPVGGVAGIVLSGVFVLMSAGGLLYNLNEVMHRMSAERVVPAAYHVTLGVLVLFWNVLVLLMRVTGRRR